MKAAIDWLERLGGTPGPFLLWLDLFSPHGPWDTPQPYRDQYVTIEPDEFEAGEEGDLVEESLEDEENVIDIEDVAALIDVPAGAVGDVISEAELFRLRRTYAGTVTLVDRWLGELFQAMRQLGRMDDTLLVFTSDQGEPLGEHGFVRRFRPWLYEELIHTPLIIRLPKGHKGGLRHQALVQTVDLLPTLISALGLKPPDRPEAPLHGHDLLPLIRGEQTKVRDYACLGMDVVEFAIRTHLWHLVVPIEIDPDEPRSAELFRKPEDRWDQNNVIEQHPEVAEHLELSSAAVCRRSGPRWYRRSSPPPRHRSVRSLARPAAPAVLRYSRSVPPSLCSPAGRAWAPCSCRSRCSTGSTRKARNAGTRHRPRRVRRSSSCESRS